MVFKLCSTEGPIKKQGYYYHLKVLIIDIFIKWRIKPNHCASHQLPITTNQLTHSEYVFFSPMETGSLQADVGYAWFCLDFKVGLIFTGASAVCQLLQVA